MKVNTPLFEFIDDFKLRHIGKGVCFNAAVHFITADKTVVVQAEVHVVGIKAKNIFTIYFIHPDIIHNDIPDMLNDQTEKFEYKKNECLEIKGNSKKYNAYTISIYPVNNICDNEIFRGAEKTTK